MRDPIVVIGCARSGTSMTAGLFAQHGCWTGRCKPADEHNARGYYENLDLKRELLQRWGRLKKRGEFAEPAPDFRPAVEAILTGSGYDGGPWVVKHGSLYWPAWDDFDPTFVCVYRQPESIMASAREFGAYMTREAICLTHGAMEWAIQHAGGIRVDAERLIAGDYTQVERAFHAADLGFDPRIADGWIDGQLWHH